MGKLSFHAIQLIITVLTLMAISCDKETDLQVPSLTTNTVTSITSTTATSGGTITSDGGAPVIARGVCWSLTQSPIVTGFKTSEGTNTFVSILNNLDGNRRYYVRAYASNSVGTAYGNEVSFVSLPGEVKIGGQIWMDKNLNTNQYLNGDPVVNVVDGSQWVSLATSAFSDYDNSTSNGSAYGHLYNWYAVTDNRKLCPAGWHVSSKADWDVLVDFLGGFTVAGGKMKETGTSHWESPNTDGTNESGFTGLPGGHRFTEGVFYNINTAAYFWTSTEANSISAEYRGINKNGPGVSVNTISKTAGLSVRCVKD